MSFLPSATDKQGFGAAMAAVGSATILGWIACTAIDGINRQSLAATGLGLTLAGGTILTAGRIQEKKESEEYANQIWELISR